MNKSTGFVTLNFTETLTEPSTTLNFDGDGGTTLPPQPTIKYLPLSAVVERLVTNAKAGHKASQDAIKTIVINKFKANELFAELDAAALPY